MASAEERLQVLRMIQSGQVTAEEGARLLEALETKQHPPEEPSPAGRDRRPRQVRIRVTDLETGRERVNMQLPWSLVNAGVRMGACFACQEFRIEDLVEAIQAGVEGKVLDMEDECERVEIFIE
jgi:hypothetical protein